MKILKAKIKVTHNNGGTQYTYPQLWLDNKTKIPAILYPNNRSDEIDDYQIVYPIIPDDVAIELLKDSAFSLPNKQEVKDYADKHAPQRNQITNEALVTSLLAKVALGGELTQDEKDALNPDNPAKGLNKSKHFLDICTEYNVDNI